LGRRKRCNVSIHGLILRQMGGAYYDTAGLNGGERWVNRVG
jgi:hypothetical protein